MTTKEAITLLQSRVDLIKKDYPDIADYAEALLMAIEALNHFADDSKKVSSSRGQENDYISRQAAIDALIKWYGCEPTDIGAFENIIEKLPSAQPKAIRPKFVAEDRYLKNQFRVFPHCPKCNYELETGDCYCRVCGCHIDWSEDDE